jgi:hypothetical protein
MLVIPRLLSHPLPHPGCSAGGRPEKQPALSSLLAAGLSMRELAPCGLVHRPQRSTLYRASFQRGISISQHTRTFGSRSLSGRHTARLRSSTLTP